MTEIRIAEGMWQEDMDGVIVTWLYDDGDVVNEGATIAEIMIEKVQIEVDSPAAGRLRITKVAEATVRPGDVIGEILND